MPRLGNDRSTRADDGRQPISFADRRPAAVWVLSCLLLGGATIGSYLPALDAGFVYDDYQYVVENPLVVGQASGLVDVLGQPFPWAGRSLGWYRPLTVLSWRLQVADGEPSARAMHAANIMLHLCVTLLTWTWLRYRLGRASALIAALLFAVMPGHAEAVLWISGRSELLVALCFVVALLGLDAFDRLAQRRSDQAGAGPSGGRLAALAIGLAIVFMAGLLAKESMASLVVVAPMLVLSTRSRGWRDPVLIRRCLLVSGLLIGIFGLYLALRVGVTGSVLPPADETAGTPLLGRLGLVGRVWWQAVVTMVWADQLTVEHYWLVPLEWTWRSLAGFLVLTGAAAGWLLSRSRAAREGVVIVLGGFGLYCHLLASTELFAERFLYLPSVGLCLLVGALLQAIRPQAGAASLTVLVMLICILAGGRTWSYARVWKDDLSLWRHAFECAPASPLARLNLGTALVRDGQPRQGVALIERVVGLAELDREARVRLISALGVDGDPRAGIAAAISALERYPDDPELLFLLARHYGMAGRSADRERIEARLGLIAGSAGLRSEAAGHWLGQLEQR